MSLIKVPPGFTNRLSEKLYQVVVLLNERLFENQLPNFQFCVIPTEESYCRIKTDPTTGERVFVTTTEFLTHGLEEVAVSIIHEMVHLFNSSILNIKDTCGSGTYHNSRFKNTAEEHGLCFPGRTSRGWDSPSASATLIEMIYSEPVFRKLAVIKKETEELKSAKAPSNRKPCSTRKYICPVCGLSVRATKVVNILCGNCRVAMEPCASGEKIQEVSFESYLNTLLLN